MTIPVLKIKFLPKPVVKGKMDVRFPANVATSNFLTVTKSNGTYTFDVDYSKLTQDPISDPTTAYIVVDDRSSGVYRALSLAAFLASSLDTDLQAIAALSGTGILSRTADGAWALRTLSAPVAGITITNPGGVAGNQTFALANDLAALEGLAGTGIARRTGPDAWSVGAAVANSELDTMANNTFKGNVSGSTAVPTDLTAAQVTAALPVATTLAKGLAPTLPNDATKYLDGTGNFTVPAGGGGGGVTDVGLGFSNISLAASVSSNILTVSLKDATGADCSAGSKGLIAFRNATASSGLNTTNAVTAALSISTFATGATLGSSNNAPFRLWVLAFNNAGTTVLALYNASTATTIFPLNESNTLSTTAMSGSATSAGVAYTPNGTTLTSNAFRILGYVEWGTGLTTAGTYASGPTVIQLMGIGVRKPGDAIQTVSASSTTNNTTTNITPTNTSLNVSITPTSAANLMQISAFGPLGSSNANIAAHAKLARGGTGIGQSTSVFSAGGIFISGVSLFSLDAPGVATSTNYAVQYWMQSAGTAIWVGGAGDGSVIQVTEIQG